MLDFPASPITGQTFAAPNGTAWKWDGVKWASTSAGTGFLPLTGGALSGDLSIASPDGNNLALAASGTTWPGIKFNIASGVGAWIGSYVGGTERWEIDLGNGIAEASGNAGSNFQLARYANNGAFLDNPLIIPRSTGLATVSGDPTAALGIATKQYVDASNVRYKNRIINGDCGVDQRHGGAAVAITAAQNAYIIDRWYFYNSMVIGGNIGQSVGQFGSSPFQSYLGFATTTAHTTVAAGDLAEFYQGIEAINFNDAQWGTAAAQPITVEFWAQGTLAGTYAVAIQNWAGTRSYVTTYTLAANTVTKVRLNIPGDTLVSSTNWPASPTTGATLTLCLPLCIGATYQTATLNTWLAGNFNGPAGTVNVLGAVNRGFVFSGAAVMVGAAAANAEPEFKKFADNLLDCQRYYETSYEYGTKPGTVTGAGSFYVLYNLPTASVANGAFNATFKVSKRASPTLTVYSPQTGASGVLRDLDHTVDVTSNLVSSAQTICNFYGTSSAATLQPQFSAHWVAEADF